MKIRLATLSIAATATVATSSAFHEARAQTREVPYWASLKSEEVNMRKGPSRDYKIEWVYKRKGMPLRVIRVVDGWRLVQDPDGEEGWIAQSLLSPNPYAMVSGEGFAALREAPADNARLRWNAQPGVVGKLGECEAGWCRLDVFGRTGWVRQDRLWGAGEP